MTYFSLYEAMRIETKGWLVSLDLTALRGPSGYFVEVPRRTSQ